MNPVYTIMESRFRWTIWAGIAFALDLTSSILMLVHGWSHGPIRVWFYLLALVTVGLLLRGVVEWKAAVEQEAARSASRDSTQ